MLSTNYITYLGTEASYLVTYRRWTNVHAARVHKKVTLNPRADIPIFEITGKIAVELTPTRDVVVPVGESTMFVVLYVTEGRGVLHVSNILLEEVCTSPMALRRN